MINLVNFRWILQRASDYQPDPESSLSSKDLEATNNNAGSSSEPERQVWDNPIEFLLSCIAMSVGLGNVWRFPFTAYENGGGAFLIPYIIVLMLIGRPMYFLELALGQFTSRSSVHVWDMVPALRGKLLMPAQKKLFAY